MELASESTLVVMLEFLAMSPRTARYAARAQLMGLRAVSKKLSSAAERVLGELLEEAWNLYSALELHVSLSAFPNTVKFGGRPVRALRLEWASSNRMVVLQSRANLLHGVSQYGASGTQLALDQ